MLWQSSLRVATLVSGTAGIAIWHHGPEGLKLVWLLATTGAMIYLMGASGAMVVTGRPGGVFRAVGRFISLLLILSCAEQAIGWIL
jgi:hypothetical protein